MRLNRMVFVFRKLVMIGLLMGCSTKSESEKISASIVDPKNGMYVTYISKDLNLEVQFVPAYARLADRPQQAGIRDSLIARDALIEYYNLRILANDRQDSIIYDDDYYYSYRMEQDIFLVKNGDTLAPILFHYEKPSLNRSHKTFVFAFDTGERNAPFSELILDSDRFGTSPIHLNLRTPKVDYSADMIF